MGDKKVFCPYCGPWNGHPDGVEMREEGNLCAGPARFGFPEQFWYSCPACGSESPCMNSRKEAEDAATWRFNPERQPRRPLTKDDLRKIKRSCLLWLEIPGYGASPVFCMGYDEDDHIWGAMHIADNEAGASYLPEYFAEGKLRYGIDWRLWDFEPTEEERKAEKWEDGKRGKPRTKAKA